MSIFKMVAGITRLDCRSFILDEDLAQRDRIAWRTESAAVDPANPLIEPRYPWDSGAAFSHGTVLIDPIDGLWKAWYISTPANVGEFQDFRRLTYATSEDGVNWTRPELDLCPQPGHPNTNIIFDFDSGGISMYACVIVHPDAEPERRYEMFCMRGPGRPDGQGADFVRGFEPRAGESRHPFATYRYYSADGIHWTGSEGPLLEIQGVGMKMTMPYTTPLGGADQASYYANRMLGVDDGGYTLYQKVGEEMHPGGLIPHDCFPWGRRVIARRTSPDGSDWSPPEIMIQPDWRDPHDQQFMELVPSPVHGGYLGLLACYNVREHTVDWQLAGSADGRIWSRPSRKPTLPVGALGDYGGGMLWPTHEFIEHDGRMYMYYGGLEGLHGDTAFGAGPNIYTFYGAICRASWEVDRYWAAVSGPGGPEEASFTTHPQAVGGKRLLLNAATSTVQEGELIAELVDANGEPVAGFARDDYQAWHGDAKAQPARWSGGDTAPRDDLAVRFFIRRARLYGFGWE
ncbi:MAG TPA: hypothetical protein QGH28_07605 [Chloroflexota bacterium]|nr:hypothetical protein [Chloroflexota bacterium]